MRFDDRFLDELKGRLRLSDVIGKSVKLRRQGREYAGLSPFTKEKTPSFFVNDDKGFYHDFSSGKHGDLISFLQETERLTFVEAVERLAAEAGMALPAVDPRAAQQEKVRQGLSDWLEAAAAWFEGELRRPGGREVRAYLEKRGMPEALWGRFRIGFAPASRTGLKDYLIAKGAMPRELVEAGLLIQPQDGGAPYDRFRNRLIFPIADARGRVVSFGGRALDPNDRAKYLNGPETELFHKGRIVYGLGEARRLLAAGEADAPLVVVEGYMDAIACHRAGVAAVAPLGTALTEEQMELLWRLHPEPTLCFDGDQAGRRAASRSMDRALPLLKPGKSFRFAIVEGGKDPDDVLREQGELALRAQLARTTPFVEALFVRERDTEPLDTPERRAGLKARLRQAANAIADKDLAQAYRDDLLRRFDEAMPQRPAFQPREKRSWTNGRTPAWALEPSTQAGRNAAKRLAAGFELVSAALARQVMADPGVLDDHLEVFADFGFADPALEGLAKEITALRLESEHLDTATLERHLGTRGFRQLLTDIDRAASQSGAPFMQSDVSLEAARSQWSRAYSGLVRLAALEDAIRSSKGNLGGRSDMAAFERLKGERDALKRSMKTGTIWADDGSL
jgi:DNA primase